MTETSRAASAYVVIDGPDGCGKSEQARRLCAALTAEGREVLHLREPGSTPVGERLRELLLDRDTGDLAPLTEALLFFAARAELLRRQIAPALSRGVVVIAERCYLSTLAYQGSGVLTGAPSPSLLDELVAATCGSCMPDRVFVLDVDYDTSVARRRGSDEDRIESRGRDYHERVREAYLSHAAVDSRVEVLDGRDAIASVHQILAQRVRELLAVRA